MQNVCGCSILEVEVWEQVVLPCRAYINIDHKVVLGQQSQCFGLGAHPNGLI